MTEKSLDQPKFQVQLEDPQQAGTCISIEVAILGSIESTIATGPKWEEGKMIEVKNKKIREDLLSQLTSHLVPYQTRLLDTMEFERNHMKLSLYNPLVQSLPFGQ